MENFYLAKIKTFSTNSSNSRHFFTLEEQEKEDRAEPSLTAPPPASDGGK